MTQSRSVLPSNGHSKYIRSSMNTHTHTHTYTHNVNVDITDNTMEYYRFIFLRWHRRIICTEEGAYSTNSSEHRETNIFLHMKKAMQIALRTIREGRRGVTSKQAVSIFTLSRSDHRANREKEKWGKRGEKNCTRNVTR